MVRQTDILVLGSGVAGLSYALEAALQTGAQVTVVTKRGISDTATSWAQGGISAVFDPNDDLETHVRDTLEAGAGLCRKEVVEFTVERGPARIRRLVELGARFSHVNPDDPDSPYDLGREGGHTKRRVIHAKDMTGAEVQRALGEAVRRHPSIDVLENQIAIDVITVGRLHLDGPDRCLGAYVLDRRTGEVTTWLAPIVVLATGGAGKVYLYTSNPDVASGDGVAMGARAGCRIANMEFFQFHPTCLFHAEAKSFLISEALRGEGGVLELIDGTEFMGDYHEMRSLAPRDIVARAIDAELKRTGDEFVVLDLTHLDGTFLVERFPGIHKRCIELGIDMRTQPIPVVPAAHYLCGGVVTDLKAHTDVPGLFAVGESACTGMHGANRLASNSLLEGLVFAHEAAGVASQILEELGPVSAALVPEWNPGKASEPDEQVVVTQNWDEIRRLMWNYVGIVRSTKRLQRARRRLLLLRDEIKEYYWDFEVTPDVVELRNIATVAQLIVESAMRRKETRGLHFTLDYPEPDESTEPTDTILTRTDLKNWAAS